MDALDALLSRRTIHDFRPDPVPEETILAALEAAVRAPNHKLTEPWRFTLLGPEARAAVVALLCEPKEGKAPDPAKVERFRARLARVPAMVAAWRERNPDPVRDREDYAACACAVHAFMLALWAAGVGSKWNTGSLARDPRTFALLGLDSERHDLVSILFAGFPAAVPPCARKPASEVVRTLP